MDVGRYSVLMEFGGIFGLVESGGFLRCGVDFNGNLRLVDFNGFLRLLFRVKTIGYKAFLLAMGADRIWTVTLGSNFTVQIFCQVSFCRRKISGLEFIY